MVTPINSWATVMWNILRVAIAAATIVAVSELSKRYPRYGALLLSLPLISILAFTFSWFQYRDLPALAKLARDTVVLVLLGLPFFAPFALSGQLGIGFWGAMGSGILLAAVSIGAWLFLVRAYDGP